MKSRNFRLAVVFSENRVVFSGNTVVFPGQEMDEFPYLDGDCTSCGYCITHCPRYSHSLRDAFPTNMWNKHIVGRIKYKCAAKSKVTIPGVQDGGFVMALLKHVLENKIIDAAIIVTNVENEPQRAKTIITSDVDSLHRGAGSKYSNGSILSILKDAKESGIKNIGIVNSFSINFFIVVKRCLPSTHS